ncbi:MAG: ROK family protein [Chloroflexota bacterium]|nr:ROK family protein [Chloroflexota bacterium]
MAALDGDRHEIVARDVRRTPREGPDTIVRALADSARACARDAGIPLHEIVAVGCAAPGPLDHRTGVVHEAPNLVGFKEFPLGTRLSDALDGLTVFVDRDTAMAAVAEGAIGAARGMRDWVYITVSTGLGGTIVSGGRMLRGATNTAGEIGHWPVAFQLDPLRDAAADLPRCGCGSFGCAESFAAGRNMADAYGVADAAEVFAAAARGDERARTIVTRAERALANLAVGLVNVLNPALIVVGGSLADNQPVHVLETMRRAIAERAFRAPAAAVRVVPAALGGDVGMLGAVFAARERLSGRGEWFL